MEAQKELMPLNKAIEEINKWLDHHKYPQRKRESELGEEQIQTLAEGIQDRLITISEDASVLTQNLRFPIMKKAAGTDSKPEPHIVELKFEGRLNQDRVEQYMKGVKTDDVYGSMDAHIAALTKTPKGMMKKVDLADLNMARVIVNFFF